MDLSKNGAPTQTPIADYLASIGINMQLMQHHLPQTQSLQQFDPLTMNISNGTVNPLYLHLWYNIVNQQLQHLQSNAFPQQVNAPAHAPWALPDCDPITRELVMDAFTMQRHKGPLSKLDFKKVENPSPIFSPTPDSFMIRFTKCRDIITRCGDNALSPPDRQFHDSYQAWLNSISHTLDATQQEHLHKLQQKAITHNRKQEGYQKGWQTRRGKKERIVKKKQGNEEEGKADVEEIVLA